MCWFTSVHENSIGYGRQGREGGREEAREEDAEDEEEGEIFQG